MRLSVDIRIDNAVQFDDGGINGCQEIRLKVEGDCIFDGLAVRRSNSFDSGNCHRIRVGRADKRKGGNEFVAS